MVRVRTADSRGTHPDGAYVVFTKIFPAGPRIVRIKADGIDEMELTTGVGAVDGHPTWSR